MPRYRLTVAYDGTDFHGWQKQHPPDEEPLRTVQGVMEEAARQVLREPVNVVGASRTDSGVHALGQVAALSIDKPWELERLRRAMNARLPEDVQIRDVAETHGTFSPISEATNKGYRYAIAHGVADGAPRPLFDRRYVSVCPTTLDVDRMREAARHLVGEHDFASLTRLHHGRESTVREVFSCDVTRPAEHRIAINVTGNGFLYNMVRIIAGTLMEVGRGKWTPDEIPGILEARDRAAAGPTLPPEGLCLMWISYGELESHGSGEPA